MSISEKLIKIILSPTKNFRKLQKKKFLNELNDATFRRAKHHIKGESLKKPFLKIRKRISLLLYKLSVFLKVLAL